MRDINNRLHASGAIIFMSSLPSISEADGEELPGLHITIKELPEILFRDVGNKIRDSGK